MGRIELRGWMGFVLKSNFKGLNLKIKELNKAEYGRVEIKLLKLKKEITVLDERSEVCTLLNQEVESRRTKFGEMWSLLRSIYATVFQRSSSKWLREGDEN